MSPSLYRRSMRCNVIHKKKRSNKCIEQSCSRGETREREEVTNQLRDPIDPKNPKKGTQQYETRCPSSCL
jgi:hypothetical protein